MSTQMVLKLRLYGKGTAMARVGPMQQQGHILKFSHGDSLTLFEGMTFRILTYEGECLRLGQENFMPLNTKCEESNLIAKTFLEINPLYVNIIKN